MKIKKSTADHVIDVLIYIIYFLFAVICIYPFYYIIINSISANDLSDAGKIMFIPKGVHLTNYTSLKYVQGFAHAALVSVARTVIGTTACVIGSSFLGFMFTQEDMCLRKFWYRYTVMTMYISAGIIPWYLTMRNLHLTNNFLAYILPVIVSPFNIILVKTYVESIPRELQEAAEIDGAGILKIFVRVILPVSKPILATIAIFTAVGQWNAFQDTLILMTKEALYTLQFKLYQYINQASSMASMIKSAGGANAIASVAQRQTATSVRMTVTTVVVLPVLIIYPLFQKYFTSGIMIGSVKG